MAPSIDATRLVATPESGMCRVVRQAVSGEQRWFRDAVTKSIRAGYGCRARLGDPATRRTSRPCSLPWCCRVPQRVGCVGPCAVRQVEARSSKGGAPKSPESPEAASGGAVEQNGAGGGVSRRCALPASSQLAKGITRVPVV